MTKMLHSLKENSGKIGLALAILTLAWSSISAYVESSTHLKDVQTQQERRISDLEWEVRNDLATRREIEDLKSDTSARPGKELFLELGMKLPRNAEARTSAGIFRDLAGAVRIFCSPCGKMLL
ncbi:MAG TPA: hypothetical protein VFP59_13990 [Candidatus Angelobacter sp.]|nr:hypothetical protein [Candidatus Angelobacter sp.]